MIEIILLQNEDLILLVSSLILGGSIGAFGGITTYFVNIFTYALAFKFREFFISLFVGGFAGFLTFILISKDIILYGFTVNKYVFIGLSGVLSIHIIQFLNNKGFNNLIKLGGEILKKILK